MGIKIEYMDDDIHTLTTESNGVYVSIPLTKKELNAFIFDLIKYTQTNSEWND